MHYSITYEAKKMGSWYYIMQLHQRERLFQQSILRKKCYLTVQQKFIFVSEGVNI